MSDLLDALATQARLTDALEEHFGCPSGWPLRVTASWTQLRGLRDLLSDADYAAFLHCVVLALAHTRRDGGAGRHTGGHADREGPAAEAGTDRDGDGLAEAGAGPGRRPAGTGADGEAGTDADGDGPETGREPPGPGGGGADGAAGGGEHGGRADGPGYAGSLAGTLAARYGPLVPEPLEVARHIVLGLHALLGEEDFTLAVSGAARAWLASVSTTARGGTVPPPGGPVVAGPGRPCAAARAPVPAGR